MKILLHHLVPFSFAGGGMKVQIIRTREALSELGVQTEYLRWYDSRQSGDIMHFFGRIPTQLLEAAHGSGMKVVVSESFTQAGSVPASYPRLAKWLGPILRRRLPRGLTAYLNWDSYRLADGCVAPTQWDAEVLSQVFGARLERVHVVPYGVEQGFVKGPQESSPGLRPAAAARTWLEMAGQLKAIYEGLLSTS